MIKQIKAGTGEGLEESDDKTESSGEARKQEAV